MNLTIGQTTYGWKRGKLHQVLALSAATIAITVVAGIGAWQATSSGSEPATRVPAVLFATEADAVHAASAAALASLDAGRVGPMFASQEDAAFTANELVSESILTAAPANFVKAAPAPQFASQEHAVFAANAIAADAVGR